MSDGWDEEDSEAFLQLGDCFVPDREEQLRIVGDLLPGGEAGGEVWELCCGEGLLSRALAERFPTLRLRAFDRSERMRERARQHLAPFADRVEVAAFELESRSWRQAVTPLRGVVSSLAIHHLDGGQKRELYGDMYAALGPGGVLVVADLIEPVTTGARSVAARLWERSVAERSAVKLGDLSALEAFRRAGWNHYAVPDPDPEDRPSPLFDQLDWLRTAGFERVDVVWMVAGHTIFFGEKS